MHDYLPNPGALFSVALTLGVGGVLLLAGTAAARRKTSPELAIGVGWGVLCLVLTLWGVFLPWSLKIPAIGFAVLAPVMGLASGRRPVPAAWRTLGRTIAIALPLWLVMAPIRPSQPDTFLNLLPNAMYLVDYGRFPTSALPPSFSYLPAAPYNTQFLTLLGGLVDPGFPAAGMSLVNVMLFLVAGIAIARALSASEPDAPLSWPALAGGLLLAVPLNPGFVPRIDFAAYGEAALTVTALLAALALIRGPPGAATAGLILTAMINAKQSGIGLVAALLGATALVFLCERGWQRAWLRYLIGAGVPAAVLYAVWRYHVARAGVDELTLLPLADWHWEVLPETFAGIAREIVGKPVYFGAVVLAAAAFPWLWRRHGWTPATRLLLLHAAAFVLYSLFLLLAYLAQFSAEMSAQAHSYFRYNTHLSLVLVTALALTVRDTGLWAPFARRSRACAAVALAIVLVGPLALAVRLRFDLVMPQPLVWNLAAAVKPYLKDDDRLALLLPGDNGSVATMLGGVLRDVPPRRPRLDLLVRDTADGAALDDAARQGYGLALVSCTGDGAAGLFARDASGWRRLAAWPYPPEASRRRWQHILAWAPLCRPP